MTHLLLSRFFFALFQRKVSFGTLTIAIASVVRTRVCVYCTWLQCFQRTVPRVRAHACFRALRHAWVKAHVTIFFITPPPRMRTSSSADRLNFALLLDQRLRAANTFGMNVHASTALLQTGLADTHHWSNAPPPSDCAGW